MSNSNLGLNRKVIKVLVDSLSDSDSKIYKDIMSITGEPSGEVDENDTLINYLTDGTEVTTLTSNAVKKVADDVFNGYNKLVTVNFPKATSIGVRSFQGCTSLNTVDFTNAKSLGNYAFKECSNLRNVTIPNVTSIAECAFSWCTSLTSIDLPNLTSIGISAFYNCTRLTSIDLPKAETIGASAFEKCSNLKTIILPNVTSIGDRAFYNFDLKKLILSNSVKVELAGSASNIFYYSSYYTPATSLWSGVKIYVPDDLVDTYKSDTNWAPAAGNIKPISQLPTE